MAKSQSNLSPQEQATLFDLLKKSGQGTTDVGQSTNVPDVQAQQGVGNVDSSGVQSLFGQPQLQMQDGDKMHPVDAMQKIAQQLMPPQPTGPQLIRRNDGTLAQVVQNPNPIFRLFKSTVEAPLPHNTNFFDTLSGALGGQDQVSKYLPGNVPIEPGTQKPFIDENTYKAILQSKVIPTSNNPSISKDEAAGLGFSQQTLDKLYGSDPNKTVPLTTLRLATLQDNVNTKKGQLGVARNKLEAGLNAKFVKAISDAEQSPNSQFGQSANVLSQAYVLRQGLATRYDPQTDEYDMSPTEVGDLMLGTARMLVRKGQLTNEQLDQVKQDTAAGNLGRAATFLFGTPFKGNTQDIIRRSIQLVDKEGLANNQLRNMYAQQQIPVGATLARINPDLYKSTLAKSYGGVDYEQLLANSPDVQSPKYLTPDVTPLSRTAAPGQPAPAPLRAVIPRPAQPSVSNIQGPSVKLPPADRYNQLRKAGLSKAQAYSLMHQEGY